MDGRITRETRETRDWANQKDRREGEGGERGKAISGARRAATKIATCAAHSLSLSLSLSLSFPSVIRFVRIDKRESPDRKFVARDALVHLKRRVAP